MPSPLGHHSPRIARVRGLATTDGRRAAGQLAIEGPTLLDEARRSGTAIRELFVLDALLAKSPGLAALEGPELPVFVVDARAMARLSDVRTPSGIVAVVDATPAAAPAVFARTGPVLVLAGVSDPGNAGTLIRSAEAFGAAGVLVLPGSVDPFGSKVVRAAMGSLFRLPTGWSTAGELTALARSTGRALIAAGLDGEDVGQLPADAVIAIGNERHGTRNGLPHADRVVRIRHQGPAESLNAAVAGSILLYLCARATP